MTKLFFTQQTKLNFLCHYFYVRAKAKMPHIVPSYD